MAAKPLELAYPDDADIEIASADMVSLLQNYIQKGSKLHSISPSDLNIKSPMGVEYPEWTIENLMQSGTPFFDAVYAIAFIQKNKTDPADSGATVDFNESDGREINYKELGRFLFANFFCLLTQARPIGDDIKFSRFITGIMKINETPSDIKKSLASFQMEKMDNTWIKEINLGGLGAEAQARFALGVAGYRLLSVFNVVEPDKGTPEEKKKVEEIKEVLAKGLSWNIHPITRSPEFVSKFKSINKGCNDLMARVYTSETLEKMKTEKLIVKVPQAGIGDRYWASWPMDELASLADSAPIFRK